MTALSSDICIALNGQPVRLATGSSVADLLRSLNAHQGKRIAVELNGEIVPRSRFTNTLLSDSDRVEIVQAIGGG